MEIGEWLLTNSLPRDILVLAIIRTLLGIGVEAAGAFCIGGIFTDLGSTLLFLQDPAQEKGLAAKFFMDVFLELTESFPLGLVAWNTILIAVVLAIVAAFKQPNPETDNNNRPASILVEAFFVYLLLFWGKEHYQVALANLRFAGVI